MSTVLNILLTAFSLGILLVLIIFLRYALKRQPAVGETATRRSWTEFFTPPNLKILGVVAVALTVLMTVAVWWDEVPKPASLLALVLTLVYAGMVGKGFWDDHGKPSIGARFIKTSTMAFMATAAILAFFLGMSWLSDPFWRNAFDPEGNPNFMVYTDVNGEPRRGVHQEEYLPEELKHLAGEFIHPSFCRPEGVPHAGFDYVNDIVGCGSPLNGNEKMRPVVFEDLPEPSLRTVVVALKTLIFGPPTSDAQAKAEKPAVGGYAEVGKYGCAGGYAAKRTDCQRLTFKPDDLYLWGLRHGQCAIWDSVERTRSPSISYSEVRTNLWKLKAAADEEVYFFWIQSGETYEFHPDSKRPPCTCSRQAAC